MLNPPQLISAATALLAAAMSCLCLPLDALGAPVVLTPTSLRTEYHTNPLGIDAIKPRFSWLLQSNRPEVRGQKQSAYEILVATSREKLDTGDGDLWKSGKVASDDTSQIVYAGEALKSGQECWWKLRTWNASDEPSP